jgi:hypothetical protein
MGRGLDDLQPELAVATLRELQRLFTERRSPDPGDELGQARVLSGELALGGGTLSRP